MLADKLKRQAPGLITGLVDPPPVFLVYGVFEDGQKQRPLGVELLGPKSFLKVIPVGRIVRKNPFGSWVKNSRCLVGLLRHKGKLAKIRGNVKKEFLACERETIFGGTELLTTERKSFFRRLAEKKGSPP